MGDSYSTWGTSGRYPLNYTLKSEAFNNILKSKPEKHCLFGDIRWPQYGAQLLSSQFRLSFGAQLGPSPECWMQRRAIELFFLETSQLTFGRKAHLLLLLLSLLIQISDFFIPGNIRKRRIKIRMGIGGQTSWQTWFKVIGDLIKWTILL